MKKLTTALALILSAGCMQDFKPKNHRVGLVFREARGSWEIFRDQKYVPSLRLQTNYELKDNLDLWTRLETTQGHFGLDMYHVNGEVSGNLNSFGVGVSYFPFNQDNLSLDAGGEIFHANATFEGELGIFDGRVQDTIFGWGANLGATYEHPIKDNVFFFATSGINFTDNTSKRGRFDFDGFYAGIGLGITLP